MKLENLWNEWKVDKYIGEGAFGKVYKIVRKDFGHTYVAALKVIEIPQNQSEYKAIKSEGFSDESAQEYFKSVVEDIVNEFALMSKLKGNSNIVSYEDHSVIPKEKEFGWEILIRMELLTPLFSYLEEHELTVKDVIQLGIDICKALEVCQKYNIIHRDIKPENIFVSDIGTFKLGDFGIARQLEKTTSGMSKKGTYTYMAPEVYKGLEYNSTVDIYSLGIVLYRFLNNNRAPFMPPAPQQIRYSDKEQANILRLSGQIMPKPCNAEGRLAEIVLKACAYDPKERYESPYAMRQELQTLLYTESEKKLAYPECDKLTNNKNEYTLDEKTEFMNVSELNYGQKADMKESNYISNELISEKQDDNDDKTVLMYQYFKAENEKIVSIDDESNETELKNVIPSKDKEEVVSNVQESDIKELISTEKKFEEGRNDIEKDKQKEVNLLKNKRNIKKEKNKKKSGIIVAVGTIVLVAVAIVLICVLNQPPKISVPNLKNMQITEAEKILKEKGLVLDKTYSTSQSIEQNVIISQEEIAGMEVKEGTTIHVVVCSAMLISIPDVVNKNSDEAKNILEGLGLTVNIIENYSDTVNSGFVISQKPENGKKIEKGSEVEIIISKGQELFEIPDVVGLKKEEAKSKLEALGMKVNVKEVYSESIEKGIVISQNISAKEEVIKGTFIDIKVSKGREKETETTVQNNSNSNPNNNTEPKSNTKSKKSKNQVQEEPVGSLDDWELIN